MIDLHSHTNESDGTYSPSELIDAALGIGLEALAITDHDTFSGYDQALPLARERGFDLVCGIELNTRTTRSGRGWDVHLLGYFLGDPPSVAFREWLAEQLESRRERNAALAANLQSIGIAIELAEVEAIGRTLTGRPHFAKVLVSKGYAENTEEAFRKYLGETAQAFVQRDSATTSEGIKRIIDAGGLPVVAHPVRLGIRDHGQEESFISALADAGLQGLEVYHSDHRPSDVQRYGALADKLGLAATGGSDFHGEAKPNIKLGVGAQNNLNVPRTILDNLRKSSGNT